MLEILYQDSALVVINKPSGLLVHKSSIDREETAFALQLVRDQIGAYVYAVHRLDKPTSGILVFALTHEVAGRLSEMFREGEVQKEYLAIVRGYTAEEGEIDHPLKQMLDTKAQKRRGITQEPKSAKTLYRRLGKVALPYPVSRYPSTRYSLVALYPKTGRKHQLRRHMKHIHHHLIGDTKHGRGEHNQFFRTQFGCHRLLLHAYRIRFIHPVTQVPLEITAPLDPIFNTIVQKLFPEVSEEIANF